MTDIEITAIATIVLALVIIVGELYAGCCSRFAAWARRDLGGN
jgi:hypothetical protein